VWCVVCGVWCVQAKLRLLSSDRALARRLGARGRRHVLRHFSQRRVALQYAARLTAIHETLQERKRGSNSSGSSDAAGDATAATAAAATDATDTKASDRAPLDPTVLHPHDTDTDTDTAADSITAAGAGGSAGGAAALDSDTWSMSGGLCYAVICYAMICCDMLCCAVLCYAVLCYAMI
jgi:hypothetical protein